MDEQLSIAGIDKDLVSKADAIGERYASLKNKKVAVSVSTNDDLEQLGLSEEHLNDITIEIARYIIANGGTAIYGGDLRVNGFTNYFSELSNQYTKFGENTNRFVNYFALPVSKNIDKKVEIDFKSKSVGVEIVPAPTGIDFDKDKHYDIDNNIEDRYVVGQCFRAMREKMANDSIGRVIVGGRISGYAGFMPGVLEEAILTVRLSKPLYIVGGFGGVSNLLANIFEGHKPEALTNDFHYGSEFRQQFRSYIADKIDYSDYEEIVNIFSSVGLEELSKNNMLSIAENQTLFHSTNIHEITYLVMKGLRKI